MRKEIRRAAVLGAGVMGSGIAAHLANAGIPVLMLDIVPPQFTDADAKKGLTEKRPAISQQVRIGRTRRHQEVKTRSPLLQAVPAADRGRQFRRRLGETR